MLPATTAAAVSTTQPPPLIETNQKRQQQFLTAKACRKTTAKNALTGVAQEPDSSTQDQSQSQSSSPSDPRPNSASKPSSSMTSPLLLKPSIDGTSVEAVHTETATRSNGLISPQPKCSSTSAKGTLSQIQKLGDGSITWQATSPNVRKFSCPASVCGGSASAGYLAHQQQQLSAGTVDSSSAKVFQNNCISEGGTTPVTPNKNELGLSSCGNYLNSASMNEEGFDSQQGTLESTDGHYTAVSAFASRASKQSQSLRVSNDLPAFAGQRQQIFYCPYGPIAEEAESKLSSEGEIRTDVSNTDESFELEEQLQQPFIDFCEDLDDDQQDSQYDKNRQDRSIRDSAEERSRRASIEINPAQSFRESLKTQLGAEFESSDRRQTEEQNKVEDARQNGFEAIQISFVDESGSGNLDDPSSGCATRKRIFSQSDVEFDSMVFDRKKINPFSSALSAAPNYHDVNQDYPHEKKPQTQRGQVDEGLFNPFQIKEFVPTGQGNYPRQTTLKKPADLQSNSSLSGACGIPTFSESLTLNDANTNWKTSAPEFVPKDLNQLTAQSQLPNQLSQLPVNATAETAFLKLNFRNQTMANNGCGGQETDEVSNSYLDSNQPAGTHETQSQQFTSLPADQQPNNYFYDNSESAQALFFKKGGDLMSLQHPGQSEKFQTMCKTEMCRNWEKGRDCQYGNKCTFAHGRHELQQRFDIPQNYKTKLCEKFHGPQHHCSYGKRCTFVHSKPISSSQSAGGKNLSVGGNIPVRQSVKRKPPSHADNLNLIIGHISARSDSQSEGYLRVRRPLTTTNSARQPLLQSPPAAPIRTQPEPTHPTNSEDTSSPNLTPTRAPVPIMLLPAASQAVAMQSPTPSTPNEEDGASQLVVEAQTTGTQGGTRTGTATGTGSEAPDQTTEQVQIAQKLFKRFGGRRLDVFKSIQSKTVGEGATQMMPIREGTVQLQHAYFEDNNKLRKQTAPARNSLTGKKSRKQFF